MIDNEQVKTSVFEVIELENDDLPKHKKIEKSLNFELYGGAGKLDSLDLVNFVVAVEQTIEDKFGVLLNLTDDKAMSQKTSPFKTIGTLVDYITKSLDECRLNEK